MSHEAMQRTSFPEHISRRSLKRYFTSFYSIAHASVCGHRQSNEDACILKLGLKPGSKLSDGRDWARDITSSTLALTPLSSTVCSPSSSSSPVTVPSAPSQLRSISDSSSQISNPHSALNHRPSLSRKRLFSSSTSSSPAPLQVHDVTSRDRPLISPVAKRFLWPLNSDLHSEEEMETIQSPISLSRSFSCASPPKLARVNGDCLKTITPGSNQEDSEHLFAGVFDGHGGHQASEFVSRCLPYLIQSSVDHFDRLSSVVDTIQPEDTFLCGIRSSNALNSLNHMQKAFLMCDHAFKDYRAQRIFERHSEWRSSPRDPGTTAVTACVRRNLDNTYDLRIAHIGDSRALLIGPAPEYALLASTKDHRPDHDEEMKRIVAAQGTVENACIDGSLPLSRAFGDFSFKNQAEHCVQEQQVISVPDCIFMDNVPSGSHLLLFCDGLFEALPSNGPESNAIIHASAKRMLEQGVEIGSRVSRLIDSALNSGSKDNISLQWIELKPANASLKDIYGPRDTEVVTITDPLHSFYV